MNTDFKETFNELKAKANELDKAMRDKSCKDFENYLKYQNDVSKFAESFRHYYTGDSAEIVGEELCRCGEIAYVYKQEVGQDKTRYMIRCSHCYNTLLSPADTQRSAENMWHDRAVECQPDANAWGLIGQCIETRKDENKMDAKALKDSGERREFDTGAVRDMAEGKGNPVYFPPMALLRLGQHYERGAKKYGGYNYLKGIPTQSFLDSAVRHLLKYLAGMDDEDHLAAAAFNILGAMEMEAKGADLQNIPNRKGKDCFNYLNNTKEGQSHES